jgi:hypothetical protein
MHVLVHALSTDPRFCSCAMSRRPLQLSWSLRILLTDLVLRHLGIYSKSLKLQCTIMCYATLQCHLTRANAGLGS